MPSFQVVWHFYDELWLVNLRPSCVAARESVRRFQVKLVRPSPATVFLFLGLTMESSGKQLRRSSSMSDLRAASDVRVTKAGNGNSFLRRLNASKQLEVLDLSTSSSSKRRQSTKSPRLTEKPLAVPCQRGRHSLPSSLPLTPVRKWIPEWQITGLCQLMPSNGAMVSVFRFYEYRFIRRWAGLKRFVMLPEKGRPVFSVAFCPCKIQCCVDLWRFCNLVAAVIHVFTSSI